MSYDGFVPRAIVSFLCTQSWQREFPNSGCRNYLILLSRSFVTVLRRSQPEIIAQSKKVS